jgi:formylglycine-generating enzyme required for sulfatase activity
MAEIELKRGHEVLSDNNVRFGIRVINTSDAAISEVKVILDYNEDLFELVDTEIQKLGTIPPAGQRTAEFILKPRGCIHKEEIGATVRYKDAQWNRHGLEMQPKAVSCVRPYLQGMAMREGEFIELAGSLAQRADGFIFSGIGVPELTAFLKTSCVRRLYLISEYNVEGTVILNFAGESKGEKVCYLLTAVIKPSREYTQTVFRAYSDKSYGLPGFLTETANSLRHLVGAVQSAREIGIIDQRQVITIIDSVVQRTSIATGGEGTSSVNIEGSVVQRAEIKADEAAKRRREEEERLRREQEEQARKAREEAEKKEREKQERLRQEEKEQKERERKESVEAEKKALLEAEKRKREQKQQKTFTNSIGMKFTLIPPGEFMMGSDEFEFEQPVHKVTIKNPFYLGTYPVTQREWKAVMGDDPSYFTGNDLPVEKVSWDDVQDFIKKLNEKEGTDKYRLSSEAEWEYACRAGTTTRFSFGDSDSNLGEYAWYNDNSGSKTHPVGQKKPNPWGLYDMHGNVWEWVQDTFQGDYNGAPTDGSAWEGAGSYRVLRGGGWGLDAGDCSAAYRVRFVPFDRSDYLGFRLVRSV